MKELLNDYKREHFTLRDWVIGAICVAALVGCCAIGEWLNNLAL